MILKGLFNEKHQFVAGCKNDNEHKQAMQMAQVLGCRSVVYDELVEGTHHLSGSSSGIPNLSSSTGEMVIFSRNFVWSLRCSHESSHS
jgi:hypothetical protein